jgi:serine/threonine protein kinase
LRHHEKLSAMGTHKNIVSILRHGVLPNIQAYYIDMELCDLDLEKYIRKTWKDRLTDNISRYQASHSEAEVVRFFGLLYVREIMKDITRGLAFIHLEGEVHRDLKPANRMFVVYKI